MESQIERMAKMWRKICMGFLCLIIAGINVAFSKSVDEDVSMDNKSSNERLMYRLLNNKTKDPSDIGYYRRWKKERKREWMNLNWLEDHRNLLDIMSDPDKKINEEGEWTPAGSVEDYRQDLTEDPGK